MKKLFYLFIALSVFVACSDDDGLEPIANVTPTSLNFTYAGGTKSITVTSNAIWSAEKNAEWLTLSIEEGKSTIDVTAAEYTGVENDRTAKVTIKITGSADIVVNVTQRKAPQTVALYILSEGNWGRNQAELAYYDVKTETIAEKYFKAQNGVVLGDTGNDLALYGSKLYCVVSGATMNDGGYIEIINPENGKSQKRIIVQDADGENDQPRNITFHKNKAYVTTYSGSVIRIDTTSLTIDGRAALSGTYPEGICEYNNRLYVCNSGQGTGTTISVVDITTFRESKTITVPQNPASIAATSTGDIYFTTADLSWSTGAPSNLHVLDAASETVKRTFDIRASRLAVGKDYVYTVDNITNWSTLESTDYTYKVDLKTYAASEFTNELEIMVYGISVNPLNNDVYITGQGQDAVIFSADGTLKAELETGTSFTKLVVPVIR